MKLVSDWKSFWKWHSTWAMAALGALPGVWASLPPDLKEPLPDTALWWIAGAVALAGIVGRVRDQG